MILNRAGIADAMGVSLPTIDRWVKEGCPIQTRPRKGVQAEFVLADVIAWYAARERDNAAGGDTDDETELKRRKLRADAGTAELNFAKAKGEVAPILEFERATAKMMAGIRANVMNVPARSVLQLLGETDETTFKRVLREELTLALEQSAIMEFDLEDDEEDPEDDAGDV